MDRTVARLNIEHYRKRLSEEVDEGKRRTLQQLLVEEEEKLAQIMKGLQDKKRSG